MGGKQKSKITHPETNSYVTLQTCQTTTSNDNLHCKNFNSYHCIKEGISVLLKIPPPKKKKKTDKKTPINLKFDRKFPLFPPFLQILIRNKI